MSENLANESVLKEGSETSGNAPTGVAPHEPGAKTVRTSSRKGLANSVLGTRNLMTIAALSVVGLIILIPLNWVAVGLYSTPQGILISSGMMGLWLIPYLLPSAVVRRPGSTMLAALIIGVISMFTTPAGYGAIIGNLMGGLFVELPLAVMLYRKYTWWAYLISSAFFGTVNGFMYLGFINVGLGFSQGAAIVVAGVVSALVGGLVVIGLTKLLNRAGVGVSNRA